MALVDYSDSDSDAEQQEVRPPPKPVVEGNSSSSTKKKPFQKLTVTSSTTTPGGGGAKKILVNLPSIGSDGDNDASPEEPPAKRARTTATGGNSRFSSFGSFLPPPKKRGPAPIAGASASASAPSTRSAPAPGVHLKTGAEPAFVRRSAATAEDGEEEDGSGHRSEYGGGLNLPAPKAPAGPSIPAGQKPEGEVKLVGKPLMFKPLSVTRRAAGAGKKKTVPGRGSSSTVAATAATGTAMSGGVKGAAAAVEAPPKKKVSLFSTDDDDDSSKPPPAVDTGPSGAYEPLFTNAEPAGLDDHDDSNGVTGDYEAYAAPPTQYQQQQSAVASASSSVSSIVDGMHLSEKAQRELFGRRGGGGANRGKGNNEFAIPANARVISFNMEKEYEHNEALRASGEQVYNPVRSIAPGKHSLRQMVNMAQNNQSALEDSFAQGRNNKKDAAGRYGWK